jgi:hypothetical protein
LLNGRLGILVAIRRVGFQSIRDSFKPRRLSVTAPTGFVADRLFFPARFRRQAARSRPRADL